MVHKEFFVVVVVVVFLISKRFFVLSAKHSILMLIVICDKFILYNSHQTRRRVYQSKKNLKQCSLSNGGRWPRDLVSSNTFEEKLLENRTLPRSGILHLTRQAQLDNVTNSVVCSNVTNSKEGQLTWVTQILYIPFSLSMSFSDGFSVVCPISKPPCRGRGKMDVETQVLMSPIVTLIRGTHPVDIYLQVSVS